MSWKIRDIVTRFQLSFDRSFSGLVKHQLLWMCLFIIIALGILFILFIPEIENRGVGQVLSTLFVDMISPVSLRSAAYDPQFSAEEYARLLLIYLVGMVFVSGLLIATISNVIRTRADSFRNGLTYYNFSDHIIILGFDSSVVYLIKELLNSYPDSTILLAVADQVSSRRDWVKGQLDSSDIKRVVVVKCRIDSKNDLMKLIPYRAKTIYLLGEGNDENRDSLNLMAYRILVDICKAKGRKNDLSCHLLIQDRFAYSLSRIANVSSPAESPYYELITMNKEEMWCRKVLVDNYSPKYGFHYPPLDREGIGVESSIRVHLVVFGMTDMGYAMALTAAHTAHYPNFLSANKKTKITFVDVEAYKKMKEFKLKYRALFDNSIISYSEFVDGEELNRKDAIPQRDFLDIEWEFVQTPYFDDTYLNHLASSIDQNTEEYLTIAVCYDSQKQCQDLAFCLPEIYYQNNIPIFYRDSTLYSYEIEMLKSDKFNNIYPFGMLDESYISDDKLLCRAKKLNFLYENVSNKDAVMSEASLQKAWKNLSTVKKWSNLYSVMSLESYLRSVNGSDGILKSITNAQMEIMAAVEHNRWNIEELLLGYRPTTEAEDMEILADKKKKEVYKRRYVHCDIKPYTDLKKISGESIYLYDAIKIVNLQLLLKDEEDD